MKIDVFSLQKLSLFAGITPQELEKMSGCLSARERKYERGTFVFQAGDEVRYVYCILSGNLHIINEDFWGTLSIIETLRRNTMFGEAYVFAGREEQLVSVMAAEDAVLLEIDPKTLFEACPKACACHTQLNRNALRIVSEKIVRLTEKVTHIMRRNTREKLLSYLSQCAQRAGGSVFDIPYSRQQLADYLCVDRSALSHEMSKLQAQGMIRYRKNHFELLVPHDEIV